MLSESLKCRRGRLRLHERGQSMIRLLRGPGGWNINYAQGGVCLR